MSYYIRQKQRMHPQNDALRRLLSGQYSSRVRCMGITALALNLEEQALHLLHGHLESDDPDMSRIAAQFIEKLKGE